MTLDKQIATAQNNIEFSRHLLDKMVSVIEQENQESDQWFIYSEKIARKYLLQAKSLSELLNRQLMTAERLNFDLSSIFTILRVQLETYATFYHLFADNCSVSEKIIRFRLWQLDGLKTRQKYVNPDTPELLVKIKAEKNGIDDITNIVKSMDYFNKLDNKTQTFLLNRTAWRFSSESLKTKQKQLNISQMIMNTGLKKAIYDDWYSVTSSHLHTTYPSIMQNDDANEESAKIIKYIGLMQGTFMNSFFVTDFSKIYSTANKTLNKESEISKQTIDSYNNQGRNS